MIEGAETGQNTGSGAESALSRILGKGNKDNLQIMIYFHV